MADQSTSSQRRHAACEKCRKQKMKCTGEQPICARCQAKGIACIYALQKPMGRPRKTFERPSNSRKTTDVEQPVHASAYQAPDYEAEMTEYNADDRGFGSRMMMVPPSDPQPWPELYATPGENASPAFHCPIPSDAALPDLEHAESESSSNQASTAIPTPAGLDSGLSFVGCACLSTMYLSLSTLQQMQHMSFPGSLHNLREAISTALEVLYCQTCPKRFLTAMHNVHMLGIFVISIAERYSKILEAIEAEAIRAHDAGEKKHFQMADLTGAKSHLHTNATFAAETFLEVGTFTITLEPFEWRNLAKKVVKAEVSGTNLCCPSFSELLEKMELRQRKWHDNPPSLDFSVQCEREGNLGNQHTDEAICLRLIFESKRMIAAMGLGD